MALKAKNMTCSESVKSSGSENSCFYWHSVHVTVTLTENGAKEKKMRIYTGGELRCINVVIIGRYRLIKFSITAHPVADTLSCHNHANADAVTLLTF